MVLGLRPNSFGVDALVNIVWLSLLHRLIFRALLWFPKIRRGLVDPMLVGSYNQYTGDNLDWRRTPFYYPATVLLARFVPGRLADLPWSEVPDRLREALLVDCDMFGHIQWEVGLCISYFLYGIGIG